MRYLLVISTLIALMACARSKSPYPYVNNVDKIKLAYKYRYKFINDFLRGRFCDAKIDLNRSSLFFARSDQTKEVAKNLYWLYILFSYLDQNKTALYNCSLKLAPQNSYDFFRTNLKSKFYSKLFKDRNFSNLFNQLKQEKDPLYKSVFARKAVKVVPLSWKEKFLNLAFEVDKQFGWTVFLIEDWKLKKKFFYASQADLHLAILNSSLQNCDFAHELLYCQ